MIIFVSRKATITAIILIINIKLLIKINFQKLLNQKIFSFDSARPLNEIHIRLNRKVEYTDFKYNFRSKYFS